MSAVPAAAAASPAPDGAPSGEAAGGPHAHPPPPGDPATTLDRFLGGRLIIEQPARGAHRAGLDAILLAATVPAGAQGLLVDLGAGVGTAGLAAGLRAPDLALHLVERDPATARLARANAARLAAQLAPSGRTPPIAVIEIDIAAKASLREAAGLGRESADIVIMNPPYFAPARVRASPAGARAAAHVLPEAAGRVEQPDGAGPDAPGPRRAPRREGEPGGLAIWTRAAAALARPDGRLALIFRGDALGEILAALDGRFGALAIRPIHPRDGMPAHRLLVTGRKGSRAAPTILPGLVLHPPAGSDYLPGADAILRGEAGL